MNTLAAIGIETWRNNKRVLPGAKTEISANVQGFFDGKGPVRRVIYPRETNQATNNMLDHFWRAIENVRCCRSEKTSFKLLSDLHITPVLILSKALADLILLTESETVKVGADPEAVYATPMLKANWWGLIMKMLKI